jgi:hypothetical protein
MLKYGVLQFYRVCGPQDICICYRKVEAISKVNENTPK